ncbi:hypothetical protein BHQ18_18340 [Mycolicibacterium flavescens]|uniref:Uncharacterized protein n=1 Tax=Mycolicibacterium flavescens TaxID=1776 RepID=A0A1E3RFZ6_MYCFV|nr:hypothetical protein BHQ18_18340 [Mycolicibacterium flavescens]
MMLFGQDDDLSEAIAAACRQHGIETSLGDAACGGPSRASPETGDTPTRSAAFIVAADAAESLFGKPLSPSSRRRLRACENTICDEAVTAADTQGVRRVLVVCDARPLSFGQRLRVERWARDLAHRIGYESRINGLTEVTTSYAVVETQAEVAELAGAVVNWHRGGHPADKSVAPDSHSPPLPRLGLRSGEQAPALAGTR